MKTLQYVGTSHFREITGENFKALGLDETRPVRVAAVHVPLERNVNRWEYFVELTNETADWLLQYEKGDWEEVDKEELLTVDELQVESTLAAGASGEGELPSQNPDGAPDASS
jgi:hypothetical protein